MPSGMPARVAVVFALLVGVTIARAERRPVAVIDLGGTPGTTELARAFNPVLQQHPDLRPIADPEIVPELYGEFRDDDARLVDSALTSRKTAEDRLAGFDLPIAEESAINGIAALEQATPSSGMIELFARLAFLRGQAQLGIPAKAQEAPRWFALAQRLDPSFSPDPARYLPDVVRAFEAAKKKWTGKGTLAIGGSGRVWIDGKDIGVAPLETEVDAGPHVVWLTGAERVTTGRQVIVPAGKKEILAIKDEPANLRIKVRRARAQLRFAPDPAARAAAMKHIADLVGVRDAVLLTSANNKIVVQTWNAGTNAQKPGFSALREFKNEKPIELLSPLAPPKAVVEDPGPGVTIKPPVEKRWYERRTVQAGLIASVLAIAVGAYYAYNYFTDDTFTLDNNTQTQTIGVRF